ncbi:helix-turn-helix transcriptional regulator [Actinophytocola sediminis]
MLTDQRRVLGERLATFRAAANLTQGQLATRVFVDRTTIAHLERGRGLGNMDMWKALDTALDACGVLLQTYLELVNARERHERHSRDAVLTDAQAQADQLRDGGSHRQLRGPVPCAFASAGLGSEPGEFLRQISVDTPVPDRISWSDVEHVRSTTRAVATAENVFGGGLSCEAAVTQLRWAGKLLDARADDDVRRAMVEAVGNLASVVAYAAFDISANTAADQCFRFALWCADHSGSWGLRANTLAEMSRKAAYLGEFDDALSMIEFAQVRADRLVNTARAMLHTLRARLLAVTSRHGEARSEIAKADAYFHDSADESTPPWLTYYDQAEHHGSIGKALIPLAHAEHDPEIAAPRLRNAVALHGKNYPRSRVFSRTRLATLVMRIGGPNDAVTIGRQVLDEAALLRSDRITRELHGLAHASTRYARIGDVNDLRHDLLELIPAKARQ